MVTENILKKIVYVVGGLIALGLIIWIGIYAINHIPTALRTIGSTATQTPVNSNGILGKTAGIILGVVPPMTYESLILFFAIFVILLFALQEILSVFSTFSSGTAWVIAFGLAIIAGVTKIIASIAGVFALTAGIGAIGVCLIIIMAIICAVIMNFIIGKAGIRVALEAKQDQKAVNKAGRNMRRGYGVLKEASEIAEEEE